MEMRAVGVAQYSLRLISRSKELSLSAEAGGFEPPVRLPVRQFSKLLVSATHPNFLKKVNI